jgi:hypothetical protein
VRSDRTGRIRRIDRDRPIAARRDALQYLGTSIESMRGTRPDDNVLNRRLHTILLILSTITALVAGPATGRAQAPAPLAPFILDSIVIERAEIYDTSGVLDMLNSLHMLTSPSVVEDEVFFAPGDTVTANDLNELDRNLRKLEVFSRISFTVVPREGDESRKVPRATLRIITKDSWSLRTGGSFSAAGDDVTLLGTIREVNLFGLALQVGGSLEYSTVNDRGWRTSAFLYEPNLGGSHVNVGVRAATSRVEKSGGLFFERPYFSERVATAYAAGASHYRGDESFYLNEGELVRRYVSRTTTTDGSGWYSIARSAKGSHFYASASLSADRTTRDSLLPFAPRAFENSVGTFIGIESIKRVYERLEDADLSGDRLIPVGGMGAVSIGKISPHNGGLDNVVYIGGEARNAISSGPLHASATIAAGTGLANKTARYTIERFNGTANLRLPLGALAARVDQSTVWNWPRYVALALDNPSGLRGYDLAGLVGDNRFVANLEYRLFPLTTVWIFDVGAAAFYDIGSVWSQGTGIGEARFHSSIGGGIRIGSANGTFNRGLLRVDLAYNFDERRISRLIISTHEAFDAFGTLEYRPPGPYLP